MRIVRSQVNTKYLSPNPILFKRGGGKGGECYNNTVKWFTPLIDEYNYELERKAAWESFWAKFPKYDFDTVPELYWPQDIFDMETGEFLDREHEDYAWFILGKKFN